MAIRKRATAPSDTKASGKETSAEAVKGADAAKTTKKAATKTTKAAAEKKTTAKKTTVKKTAAKKAVEKKETFIVQFRGREVSREWIEQRFQDTWTKDYGRKISEVKTVSFYVKPEESAVYFVVNNDASDGGGSFQI